MLHLGWGDCCSNITPTWTIHLLFSPQLLPILTTPTSRNPEKKRGMKEPAFFTPGCCCCCCCWWRCSSHCIAASLRAKMTSKAYPIFSFTTTTTSKEQSTAVHRLRHRKSRNFFYVRLSNFSRLYRPAYLLAHSEAIPKSTSSGKLSHGQHTWNSHQLWRRKKGCVGEIQGPLCVWLHQTNYAYETSVLAIRKAHT